MQPCRIDTAARTTAIAPPHTLVRSNSRVGLGATARVEANARTQFTHSEEHPEIRTKQSERANSWRGRRATQFRHHRFDSRILTQRPGPRAKTREHEDGAAAHADPELRGSRKPCPGASVCAISGSSRRPQARSSHEEKRDWTHAESCDAACPTGAVQVPREFAQIARFDDNRRSRNWRKYGDCRNSQSPHFG
jgi:hypothetical protein